MATDMVDDLHCAEDRIGLLEHCIKGLLDAMELPGLDECEGVGERLKVLDAVVEAQSRARTALSSGYCRPSCTALWTRVCEDDAPECCGCPCGHPERMVCDTCGTVGTVDDLIEVGGECAHDWCEGTIKPYEEET